MRIGYAIRLCRQQRGLTQAKLAGRSGVSVSYLSLLERGERRDPGLSTLESISEALDMPLSVLLFLATEEHELEGLEPEMVEKLSRAALQLMKRTA